MNFHLAHIIPGKLAHGMNGYKDVIDTVHWGLESLGHKASYGLNAISEADVNIIFGFHMLPLEVLSKLPPQTIVYNFEQMRSARLEQVKPHFKVAADRFQIWDFSPANLDFWSRIGARKVCVVPVGYAPILQRIPKPEVQDIDVLIYGMPGNDRLSAYLTLCHSGFTSVFVCGLYGQARDDLIARSKLILNLHLYTESKIFEVVRVSYLLANSKAVVANVEKTTEIDEDLRRAVACFAPAHLVNTCEKLLSDDTERSALENAGFEAIQRRDIGRILNSALELR